MHGIAIVVTIAISCKISPDLTNLHTDREYDDQHEERDQNLQDKEAHVPMVMMALHIPLVRTAAAPIAPPTAPPAHLLVFLFFHNDLLIENLLKTTFRVSALIL